MVAAWEVDRTVANSAVVGKHRCVWILRTARQLTKEFKGYMSKTLQKQPIKRFDYEPPQVVAVSLRPDEAVLGHCKIAGSAGPVAGSCQNLSCRSLGS